MGYFQASAGGLLHAPAMARVYPSTCFLAFFIVVGVNVGDTLGGGGVVEVPGIRKMPSWSSALEKVLFVSFLRNSRCLTLQAA